MEREQAFADERGRIARDMHDAVGARLTQISLLHDLAISHPDLPENAREKLQIAAASTHEIVTAIDEIVWSMNPRHDHLVELAHYFAHSAREYLRPLEIDCRVTVQEDLCPHAVASRTRHALLLMLKECLQNVAKHAHARTVTLEITTPGAELLIRVVDDGCGVRNDSPDEFQGGQDGFRNLRERAASLHGSFEVAPAAPSGTAVLIRVPIRALS